MLCVNIISLVCFHLFVSGMCIDPNDDVPLAARFNRRRGTPGLVNSGGCPTLTSKRKGEGEEGKQKALDALSSLQGVAELSRKLSEVEGVRDKTHGLFGVDAGCGVRCSGF